MSAVRCQREKLWLPPGDAGDLLSVGITMTTPFGGPDGHSARDQILLTVASSNTNVIDIASLNCAGRNESEREMSSQHMNPGVVVGVDGSSSSRKAIQWAAHEARMRNVPLTLVHVAVTPSWGPAPWLLSNDPLPVPAEEDYRHLKNQPRKIITDAIKIAEGSTHGTDRPEINRRRRRLPRALCAAGRDCRKCRRQWRGFAPAQW